MVGAELQLMSVFCLLKRRHHHPSIVAAKDKVTEEVRTGNG